MSTNLSFNDPAVRSVARREEARVETQAQRKQRHRLMLGVCAAVQALVAYETRNGREVERLLDEAEHYARLAAQGNRNAAVAQTTAA